MMGRLDKFSFKDYFPITSHKNKNIGLLIDGPNMLRKEFFLNLDSIKELLEDIGSLKVAKALLNQYASDKLIEAIVNQGFSPMMVAGEVDVQLAIEAYELIYNPTIEIIALMTRNAEFLPIINLAKENGKKTIVLGAEPGFSVALKNAADIALIVNENPEEDNTKLDEEIEEGNENNLDEKTDTPLNEETDIVKEEENISTP